MARLRAVRGGWVVRACRVFYPDGNPLRRTVDRLEGALVAALGVAFLVLAPLAVVIAGHVAYGDAVRTARAEQADWRHVGAVLLSRSIATDYTGQAEAVARWTAPDGAKRTGLISAPAGARAGRIIRLWTDASGRLTGPPLTAAQVRGEEMLAAVIAPVAVGLVLLCAGTLVHYLLGRRRLAAWDEEWRATGPQWSKQR